MVLINCFLSNMMVQNVVVCRQLPQRLQHLQLCQRCSSSSVSRGRKKLVILGTGWGSYSVLRNINKKLYDVIVVSPRNHFLFTPLLASTTVGTLEFRSIIEPIRNTGFRESAHFHLARAVDVDIEKNVVKCESSVKSSLQYSQFFDKLVIGVGALSNTLNVPGVEKYAFFLKEVGDARRIRNRILNNFELAVQPGITDSESQRLLHIVIVGGGPTGVEFGAELYDFVQQDVMRLYKQQQKLIQVTLIESNQILASFDERLRQFATKKISNRERFDLVQSSVTEVKEDCVTLADGRVIPCGMVVWSTGLAPRDFTRKISVQKNPRGQILTDRKLRVLVPSGDALPDVYAIGDCADISDMSLPCTAQVAEREGRYLAQTLNKVDEDDVNDFKFSSMGMLAYIGGYQALADTPELKIQGFTSWLLWRSAYLTRLGSWRLRMQVPMDWTKTLMFGRDTSRFD